MKKYFCVCILLSELYNSFAFMHLSAAIPGVDPRDIWGYSMGFADFCRQFLARDGGIEPLLHFRGKIHRERPAGFVTSPPFWKWKIRTAGTGHINNSRHLARKYARIFLHGHYLFREPNSFLRAKLEENCELRGTDNVQGQISEHISPQMEAIIFIIL